MVLPPVPAWIIDYPTAQRGFLHEPANVRAEMQKLFDDEKLKICHCEADIFRKNGDLRPIFMNGADCVLDLEPDIIDIASNLPDHIGVKVLRDSDQQTIMIAATAIYHTFGLVSLREGPFLTPLDLAAYRGVVTLHYRDFLDRL